MYSLNNVVNNLIGEKGAVYLTQIIQKLLNLNTLILGIKLYYLDNNGINNEGASKIFPAIKVCKKLEILNLGKKINNYRMELHRR